jgi:predicted dienelactone hydrolase
MLSSSENSYHPSNKTGSPKVPATSLRNLVLAAIWALILSACSDGSDTRPELALAEPAAVAWDFGTFAVGHQRREAIDATRGNRVLPYDVWYPVDAADAAPEPRTIYPLFEGAGLTAERAVEDLPVSRAGDLALLVFSHGSGGTNTQSVLLMETLASHGFVVVSPEHTGNTNADFSDTLDEAGGKRVPDVSFFIDTFLARNETSGDDFFQRLDPAAIGVLGHSFGGGTALGALAGFFGAGPDDRVRAVMPISVTVFDRFSDQALAAVEEPVLFLGGTLDSSVPIENHDYGFDQLTGAAAVYQVDVIDATHTHFANVCAIGNWLIDNGIGQDLWPAIGAAALTAPYEEACSEQALPIEEVLRIQNLYAVAFFRRHLRGEVEYDYYLRAVYAAQNEPGINYRERFSR